MTENDVPIATSNKLGIAGFVTSIIAIFTAGALSPISLVLSLLGLRREPRGYAIAGTVISVAGLALGAIVLALFSAGKKGLDVVNEELEILQSKRNAIAVIETHRAANDGAIPELVEGNEILSEQGALDPWGQRFRYERGDDTYWLRSAGPDGVHQSDDDELAHPDDE